MRADFDVVVAGAGPTGLTLAIDLGRRGVRTLLLERNPEPGPWPKMERCNARSMEMYRRLGLADAIRAAGYPPEASMDVFVAASMADARPILRLRYPSVAEYRRRIASTNDGSQPLEPYQLVSQYALEPVLKAAAEATPNVSVRFGCALAGFTQDADGVTVRVEGADGSTGEHRAAFLAACDGGASPVRKALGIALEGDGRILRMSQVQFRSRTLYDRIPMGKGRHYYLADGSTFVVQGNRLDFTLHTTLPADTDFAPVIRALIPFDFDFEVLRVNSWHLNLLVAASFRQGRVFLAGDAAHLVIPNGGLGMNTGVGDAFDLSWKLAGTVHGWGGPRLLESYETERRSVALFNREASRHASSGVMAWRAAVTPALHEPGPAGERERARIAEMADRLQRRSHEMDGAERAYHYAGSPLTWPEDGPPPPWEFGPFEPTAQPGVRLPHLWLDDGRAIADLIGADHALLRLDDAIAVDALVQAFERLGAPLQVLTLDAPHARRIYGASLLLLRPDLHVAWRGDALPADAAALAARATGHV